MKDNNLENTQKNSHLYEIIDVPQATGVMFRTSVDEGSYIPTHWHRAVEIIYLLEGKLEVTIESQTFLMQADDCTLINANIMHSTKCTQPNTAILLQIPVEFMEIYIPNIQQLFFLLDENSSDLVRQTKMARFKETLTQMQIANDIRDLFCVLTVCCLSCCSSCYTISASSFFHQISVRRTKTVTGWI